MAILVIGLGLTGKSCAKYFLNKGNSVTIWDDKIKNFKIEDDDIFASAVLVSNENDVDWPSIKFVVISPAIKFDHHMILKAQSYKIPLINDINLFLEAARENSHAKLIGVTGSNGKSTTVMLIQHLLRDRYISCGNIGLPLTEFIDSNGIIDPQYEGYVIEMSSAQLQLVESCERLDIGILMNITPNHFDMHDNMENYIKEKKKILDAQKVIISIDNQESEKLFKLFDQNQDNYRDKYIPISIEKLLENGVSLINNDIYHDGQKIFSISSEILENLHNIPKHNVLVAIFIAKLHRVSENDIIDKLLQFKGLQYRIELIDKININDHEYIFINDSKSTTIASSIFALKYFANKANAENAKVYWITGGGDAKRQNFHTLIEVATLADKIFLVGDSRLRISEAFKSGDIVHEILERVDDVFLTLNNEMQLIKSQYKHNEDKSDDNQKSSQQKIYVVFSPTGESFDHYKNYKIRGDKFDEHVSELKKSLE